MGGRPTRYESRPVEAQAEVDAYKARSVWGRWWALEGGLRDRLFTPEEVQWVKRYGRKLDQLSSFAREPANDRERHFVAVCRGDAQPTTDRERLWLRVRVVCRYEASLERATRCDVAEHHAATWAHENLQLRRDVRRLEQERDLLYEELQVYEQNPRALQQRSIRNIDDVTPLFVEAIDGADPAPPRPPSR